MLDPKRYVLITLSFLLFSCNAIRPSLPDSNRPPNLIEQLCSCTNSEGRTMDEAARLYQKALGIRWDEFINKSTEQTEDWVRDDFFADELYYNKLMATADKVAGKERKKKQSEIDMLVKEAADNYPFCANQMSKRMVELLY